MDLLTCSYSCGNVFWICRNVFWSGGKIELKHFILGRTCCSWRYHLIALLNPWCISPARLVQTAVKGFAQCQWKCVEIISLIPVFCWLTSPPCNSVHAHFCFRHFLTLPHALTFLYHSCTTGRKERSVKTGWWARNGNESFSSTVFCYGNALWLTTVE